MIRVLLLLQLLASPGASTLIGPRDALWIRSLVHTEFQDTLWIRPDSTVSLPYLGEIKVLPMPVKAWRDTLNRLYARYFTEPAIDVLPLRVVYVFGDVKRPGRYFLPVGSGVVEALALAGGPNVYANLKGATLRRGETLQKIDLKGILQGKHPDLELQSGDVLFVPQKSFIFRITNFQTLVALASLAWSVYLTFWRR